MSAVSIHLTSDSAWMAVDGAVYRYGEGRAEAFQQKAHPLVHLNAVVSVRGPQAYAHRLLPALSARFASFDDLVSGLHLAAWVVHEDMKDELAALYGKADVEIYLAGVSSRGPEAYVVCSHIIYGDPWTRLKLGDFACAPAVAPSAQTDIPAAALDVIQRQRLERDEHGLVAVGGHVQIVQVTAEAVHMSVLRPWPDQVGEPLGLAA